MARAKTAPVYQTDIDQSREDWEQLNVRDTKWWRPKRDETGKNTVASYIRILPAHPSQQGRFYWPSAMHFGVGPEGLRFACRRRLLSEKCPACDKGFQLQNEGNEEGGRKLLPSMQGLLNIVECNKDGEPVDDEPEVQIFSASKAVMDALMDEIDEVGDITDMKKGRLVTIRTKITGKKMGEFLVPDYRIKVGEPSSFNEHADLLEEMNDLTKVNEFFENSRILAALEGGPDDWDEGQERVAEASRPKSVTGPVTTASGDEVEPEDPEPPEEPEAPEEPEDPDAEPTEPPPARKGRRTGGSGSATQGKLRDLLKAGAD